MIELQSVTKIYKMGDIELRALNNVSLTIAAGDLVAIMGASGSGKSTMMNILGCLDIPTEGVYRLDGVDVGDLKDNALAEIRNRKIGFVFQSFNLIPRTSAMQNVELPLVYNGVRRRRAKAQAALERVGLGSRMGHVPSELSGGQKQRVAIAQSLAMSPRILLMDEPFSGLDPQSREVLQLLLLDIQKRTGITIFFVTHDLEEAVFLGTRILVFSQEEGQEGAALVHEERIPRFDSRRAKETPEFNAIVHLLRDKGFKPNQCAEIRQLEKKLQ